MQVQQFNSETLKKKVFALIADVTGLHPEELDNSMFFEADLGLDSIKMVSLMNECLSLVNPQETHDFSEHFSSSAFMSLQTIGDLIDLFQKWESDQVNKEQIMLQEEKIEYSNIYSLVYSVYSAISSVTGHHLNDLEPGMYLEGDLGLDSIKMVSLLNELTAILPSDKTEAFLAEHPPGFLMELETVGDITGVIKNFLSKGIELHQACHEQEELVILNSQYPLLISYMASVSPITIASGVKVKGRLSYKVLHQAWELLIRRHPTLQAVFSADSNAKSLRDYKMITIQDFFPPQINRHIFSDLSKDEQKEQLKHLFEQRINQKFDIFTWPLHRIETADLGNGEFEIILSISHLISDGLGNQQLLRELLEIYECLTMNCIEHDNNYSVNDYNRLASSINSWNHEGEKEHFISYMKQQGRSRYFFRPAFKERKPLDLSVTCIHTETERYSLSQSVTEKLITLTGVWKVSLYAMITAAFIDTVHKLSEERENIIINLPTSGKVYPHEDATGVIGAFAQNLALTFYQQRQSDSWEHFVREVDQEIRIRVAEGLDRSQINQAAFSAKEQLSLINGKIPKHIAGAIHSSLKSNLYLSYVGETHLPRETETLRLTGYEAYTCTNPGTIDTLIEMFNGALSISTNYDSNYFERHDIACIMDQFIGALTQISQTQGQRNTENKTIMQNMSENEKQVLTVVCQSIEKICRRRLSLDDADKDLEASFGLDSLERIRVITNLGKTYPEIQKASLFECRTIRDLTHQISKQIDSKGEIEAPFLKIVAQCKRTPNLPAVYDQGKIMTYKELEEQSNRLARCLADRHAGNGSIIGVMTSPGSNMLISMISILKSGAAYVPIDPELPKERIRYMMADSGVRIVLTEAAFITDALNTSPAGTTLVLLDEGQLPEQETSAVLKQEWASYPSEALVYSGTADDLMTVLYTSGSTGRPKGVLLNHKGYSNRFRWQQKLFELKIGERVAQKTSCSFDVSMWELFWPLMHGGTVCPVPKNTLKNPWALAEWIRATGVSIIHFVPSLFGEFIHALDGEQLSFPELRWILFSGEVLPAAYIQKWLTDYGHDTKLVNLYGPTEASIDVTYHIIDGIPKHSVPIGRPADNVSIKIVNSNLAEQPTGTEGEICIGGIQLSKGYLHLPDKTREVFVKNPFPDVPGDFLYRTGDLAVIREDGSLHYLGRLDQQVKIRGYRVELTEIEAVLSTYDKIKETAVLCKEEEGQKQLIAYMSGEQTDEVELKRFLSEKLAPYMIPHQFIWVKTLPKNANGKLDREAIGSLSNVTEQEKIPVSAEEIVLPLAPAQRWLTTYFEFPYQWTGYTRFAYKQRLDTEVFNQALSLLAKRHEVLRSYIRLEGAVWKQVILPWQVKVEADIYDGTHLTNDEQEVAARDLINETIQQLRADCWPLWKTVVIKKADDIYDMSIIGHHLISDMMTNQILFKDMWSIYRSLLQGETPPDPKHDSSYTRYVRDMEELKRTNGADYLDYWKREYPSRDCMFQLPPDTDNGPNNEQSADMVAFSVRKDISKALLERAKKVYGTNVYPLLLAPLYKSLQIITGRNDVIVSHRVHGRKADSRLYMSTAGDFALQFPLKLEMQKEGSWKHLISQIKVGLDKVPLDGISYDLCGDELPGYLYPDTKLTSIRANYLGNRNMPSFQHFEFPKGDYDKRHSLPKQKRISNLEYFFSVENGVVKLEIEYSKNMYTTNAIQLLGEQYLKEMEKLFADMNQLDQLAKDRTAPGLSIVKKGLLHDKTLLVTGGGRGIGKAIAVKAAAEGARVVILGRNINQLKSTIEEIQANDGKVCMTSADITNRIDVKRAFQEATEAFGSIDAVVNNAGITKIGEFTDIPQDEWEEIIRVNLFGTYNVSYEAIPYLKKQRKGKLVNIGSDSSFIGYPLMSAYSASKHAILGLTKSLAEELKPFNIQVNAVCPAFADTNMTPASLRSTAIPPEEIAETVCFLASEKSNFITGESLKIYGKQDMYWFGSKQIPILKTVLKNK